MATQEERLATLERSFASFQKETVSSVVEINEKYTMLFGVFSSQEQDIKSILTRLGIIEQRLGVIDNRIVAVEQRLEGMEATLRQHKKVLDEHTKVLNEHTKILAEHSQRFDRVEGLLMQILERLPR